MRKKTQAIDLFWLRGAIRELDITPQKMPSGRNIADLWTAAVTRAVLLALLVGRRRSLNAAGHTETPEQRT